MKFADIRYYLVVAVCAVLFTQLYFSNTREYERGSLEKLTTFSASKPFQYRILPPVIASVAGVVVPLKLEWIYKILTAFSAACVLILFRRYLETFLPKRQALFGSFVIIYPMIWNYFGAADFRFYYPSDIPAVAFFIAGLLALQRRNWIWYYAIFIVATFNRETSCFLTIAYVLTAFRTDKPTTLLGHAGVQLAIWLGIKALLATVFGSNDGVNVYEDHIADNVAVWARVFTLNIDRQAFAMITVCGAIWLLLPFRWQTVPPFMKRSLLVAVPMYIGMFIVGNLHEIRIFNEAIPIVTAPAVWTLYALAGKTVDQPDGTVENAS